MTAGRLTVRQKRGEVQSRWDTNLPAEPDRGQETEVWHSGESTKRNGDFAPFRDSAMHSENFLSFMIKINAALELCVKGAFTFVNLSSPNACPEAAQPLRTGGQQSPSGSASGWLWKVS